MSSGMNEQMDGWLDGFIGGGEQLDMWLGGWLAGYGVVNKVNTFKRMLIHAYTHLYVNVATFASPDRVRWL